MASQGRKVIFRARGTAGYRMWMGTRRVIAGNGIVNDVSPGYSHLSITQSPVQS